MTSATTITIPNVELTLDQLITAVRQLEPEARVEVAEALLDAEMDIRLTRLIQRLTNRKPADDVTNADILAEVKSVRTIQ